MSQTRIPFQKFTEGDFIHEIRRLNRVISKLSYERDDLQQENKQLKDRISKAIECIEIVLNSYKENPENALGLNIIGLLEILKEDNKEGI
jgi:hypothetical protein